MNEKAKSRAELGGDQHLLSMACQVWEKPILQDYGSIGHITNGSLTSTGPETGTSYGDV